MQRESVNRGAGFWMACGFAMHMLSILRTTANIHLTSWYAFIYCTQANMVIPTPTSTSCRAITIDLLFETSIIAGTPSLGFSSGLPSAPVSIASTSEVVFVLATTVLTDGFVVLTTVGAIV
jgi:hypothetical protein